MVGSNLSQPPGPNIHQQVSAPHYHQSAALCPNLLLVLSCAAFLALIDAHLKVFSRRWYVCLRPINTLKYLPQPPEAHKGRLQGLKLLRMRWRRVLGNERWGLI